MDKPRFKVDLLMDPHALVRVGNFRSARKGGGVTRAHNLDRDLDSGLAESGGLARALGVGSVDDLDLDKALASVLLRGQALVLARDNDIGLADGLDIASVLDRARSLARDIAPALAKELQLCRTEFPSDIDREWLHKKYLAWLERLRSCVISYRQIGYHWNFDARQLALSNNITAPTNCWWSVWI
jgi:hypothetical protein